MKIVSVRFTTCRLAFDDERMPVIHHFHSPDTGLTLEVRHRDRQTFVYGWVERDGVTSHAGQHNGSWSHSPSELSYFITSELLRVADELCVEAHHVWPFIEQLPLFTDAGVDVAEALALAGPIKDLLARGAPPLEVMSSLDVDRATIEFVLGTKLPPARELFNLEHDPDADEDDVPARVRNPTTIW